VVITDERLADAAPTHVVVVDDRVDRRRVLSATLRSGVLADLEISEVDGAALALAVVRGRHVDAVLVEISVPGSIGLITAIRRCAAEMVILVCSFQTDPVTRGRALDAGATAYLTKPIGARQLQRAVIGEGEASRSGAG
jgi:DNA-binding response OmpR family regulator